MMIMIDIILYKIIKNHSTCIYTMQDMKTSFSFGDFFPSETQHTSSDEESDSCFLKHQKTIAKYMSSHTLNDSMLISHEMGTGKTYVAIALINKIFLSKAYS